MTKAKKRKTDEPEFDDLYPLYKFSALKDFTLNPKTYIAGKGFLKEGGGCLLIGSTGMGKSVLAEQIGISVAAGKNILGKITVPRPRKVLYVQSENAIDILHKDIPSIVKHIKANEKLVEKNFDVRYMFGLTNEEFGAYIEEDVKRFKPKLLIVDYYESFVDGDINLSATFRRWVNPISEVIKDCECALLLVSHTFKPRDTSDWDWRYGIYRASGSAAIANWARTSCELTPDKDNPRRFRLSFSKNSSWTGMRNGQGGILKELWVEHSHNPETPYWSLAEDQSPGLKVNLDNIVRDCALQHMTWNQKMIAEHLGLSPATVSKHMPKTLKEKRRKMRK
jgi:hypothetical protein